MLDHIGQPEPAEKLRQAIATTIREREDLTPDLGGNATTARYKEALLRRL
jgi:isocitrate dehydrogenase (NAD+)